MKFPALALLIVAAPAAFAQTAGEVVMQDAFTLLRQKSTILFHLQGYDAVGTRSTDLQTDVIWKMSPSAVGPSTAQLELNEFKDATLVDRTVGDGHHLWNMDFTKNEYSVARYGSYTAPQPNDYMTNLLQSFAGVAHGQSIHIARVIREVFGSDAALYRPWMPGATETVLVNGSTPVTDPVATDRIYSPTPTTSFVLYSYAKSPQRSLCFEIDNGELTCIFFADKSPYRTTLRYVNFSIDVQPDPAVPGNFQFVPPPKARVVASPKPSSNG